MKARRREKRATDRKKTGAGYSLLEHAGSNRLFWLILGIIALAGLWLIVTHFTVE